MSKPAFDPTELPAEERLRLLERLWDSLSDSEVPLTNAQRKELDRRLDEIDREGPRGIPWDEVLERLEAKP
jgi:putative addiction module component (TIGR02574 family)